MARAQIRDKIVKKNHKPFVKTAPGISASSEKKKIEGVSGSPEEETDKASAFPEERESEKEKKNL